MYFYNDRGPTEYQKQEALRQLRAMGITRVEIGFSGGNDEGGADSFDAFDADGNKVDLPVSDARESSEWNPTTKNWESKGWTVYEGYDREANRSIERPATDEEMNLARQREVLEAPIYDRYGSFGGEFYVDGTLVWDIAKGTNEMHGQEQVSHWESF